MHNNSIEATVNNLVGFFARLVSLRLIYLVRSENKIMTKNDAGLLTFRVFAAYALIRGFVITAKTIQKWPRMWPEQDRLLMQTIMFMQIFGPLILLLIFSVILWRIAPRLTNKIFTDDNQFTESANKAITIISLVLSCIGLYLLVDATAEIVRTIITIYGFLKYPSVRQDVNMYILTTILKLAIGFGLLLRGKELVIVVHKQRNE
jgi:hypothetical protein